MNCLLAGSNSFRARRLPTLRVEVRGRVEGSGLGEQREEPKVGNALQKRSPRAPSPIYSPNSKSETRSLQKYRVSEDQSSSLRPQKCRDSDKKPKSALEAWIPTYYLNPESM